jgi:hypothetical protein
MINSDFYSDGKLHASNNSAMLFFGSSFGVIFGWKKGQRARENWENYEKKEEEALRGDFKSSDTLNFELFYF